MKQQLRSARLATASRASSSLAAVFVVVARRRVCRRVRHSAATAASAHGDRAVGDVVSSHPATVSPLNNFTQLPHGIQPDLAFLACQGISELMPTGLHPGSSV